MSEIAKVKVPVEVADAPFRLMDSAPVGLELVLAVRLIGDGSRAVAAPRGLHLETRGLLSQAALSTQMVPPVTRKSHLRRYRQD